MRTLPESTSLEAASAEIADVELVRALAACYRLGYATEPMRRVERSWAGHVWEVETTSGRVVLTELFDYVKPEDIEVEAGLVERAIAAGIAAPPPLRTTEGLVVAPLRGANWRAHRWVRFGPAPSKPPAPQTAAAFGRVLARLHALRLPPPVPVVRWLTHRRPEQAWQALAERARRDGVAWAGALTDAVPGFAALDTICDGRDPNARAILSHAWAAPDAVRIARSGEVVVVGWEHAGAIPPDWELASALRAWSEGDDLELGAAAAQALLDAYRELAGGPDRIEPSMFTASVSGWLNWTATRAQIALTCDDEERRELADRNIPALLSNPLTVAQIERLAERLT